MAKKLFVGSLSWDTTDDQLHEFFSQIGEVTSATVIKDRVTGMSRGFGFVEMGSDELALDAIQKLNGQELDNRSIVVNEARPPAPRRDNSRGGDNRGGGYNRSSGGSYNRSDSRNRSDRKDRYGGSGGGGGRY